MPVPQREGSRAARLLAGACCLALAAAGCGGPAGPKLVPVAGRVTVNGLPVKAGTLSFRPDKAKGNAAEHEPYSAIDADGRFKLFTNKVEGAPAGWYKVAIMAGEPVEVGNLSGQARWFANPKYASVQSSGLAVEVVADAKPGAYDFQLEK